jgi:hypothetical protein
MHCQAKSRRGTGNLLSKNGLRLTAKTLVLVGEYEVTVAKGSITICGAIISPDSGPQVVFAPTTHALPVIEATRTRSERESKRKPTDQVEYDVEIVISSHYSGLSNVGQLCPLFGGIWTSAAAASEKIAGATFCPVSCQIHGIRDTIFCVSVLTLIDLCNNTTAFYYFCSISLAETAHKLQHSRSKAKFSTENSRLRFQRHWEIYFVPSTH